MNSLNTDLIQYIVKYLTSHDIFSLRMVNKYFHKSIRLDGYVEDPTNEISHSKIIYTQSWHFTNYILQKNGTICWTCGCIFTSRNRLFKHLYIYSHYRPKLRFQWENLSFNIRSLEDISCVLGNCDCPSRSITKKFLYNLRACIVYTRYGKVNMYNTFYKGHMDGLLQCGRRINFPCIFMNFLNIYVFQNHFWIIYYKSYDDQTSSHYLVTPVLDIQEIQYRKLRYIL